MNTHTTPTPASPTLSPTPAAHRTNIPHAPTPTATKPPSQPQPRPWPRLHLANPIPHRPRPASPSRHPRTNQTPHFNPHPRTPTPASAHHPPAPTLPNRDPTRTPPSPERHPSTASRRAATLLALISTALVLSTPTTPARASPSTWRWPLDGQPRIVRRFTPPPEPWLAGHRGIDLAAPAATPVLAAGPGTIRFAGPVAGKGVVTIDHPNGLRTTYLPVTASVRRGDPIAPGAKLGVLEAAKPHCEESCLHWGLIRDARYLNPLQLLGHAPTRLLPFWPKTTTADHLNPLETHNSPPPNRLVAASPRMSHRPPHITMPSKQQPLDRTHHRSAAPAESLQITPPPITSADLTLTVTASYSRQSSQSDNNGHTPQTAIPPPPRDRGLTESIQSLTRAATTPLTAATDATTTIIGLGTVLGTVILIVALRRTRLKRHTRPIQHTPPKGQHRKRRRHRSQTRKRRPPTSPGPR
ncbi:peptidoglycan DD-metalloendopeptidase family protein [Nonomuraea sp. KM90]|uniref:peptidoglycan DD-metalloendopeptidase family protein n=1 Tax=Nonomuraea sp. KM90 TaxID=3457428 RepID=UPI003FCD9AA4